jgi:hypothetical protein
MKRFVSLILLFFVLSVPTVSAQRFLTWTVSATVRYVRRCYEQQKLESKFYGTIPGETQNKEFLVSARNRDEAEKFGYEAASKVPGGMTHFYEGLGEFEGKPCHIYVFAEVENLTVESEPIEPIELAAPEM